MWLKIFQLIRVSFTADSISVSRLFQKIRLFKSFWLTEFGPDCSPCQTAGSPRLRSDNSSQLQLLSFTSFTQTLTHEVWTDLSVGATQTDITIHTVTGLLHWAWPWSNRPLVQSQFCEVELARCFQVSCIWHWHFPEFQFLTSCSRKTHLFGHLELKWCSVRSLSNEMMFSSVT